MENIMRTLHSFHTITSPPQTYTISQYFGVDNISIHSSLEFINLKIYLFNQGWRPD